MTSVSGPPKKNKKIKIKKIKNKGEKVEPLTDVLFHSPIPAPFASCAVSRLSWRLCSPSPIHSSYSGVSWLRLLGDVFLVELFYCD
jgi:hypothetical protein